MKQDYYVGLHPYAKKTLEALKLRTPWETEFLQAVEEVFTSVSPLIEANPIYKDECILERIVEPERVISFRVPWTDDHGKIHVERGYRVQFNSALGPYKGGTRFHSSVNLNSMKFLGFEQTFKNALTGLPLGGGKGGADFDFRMCSDHERMVFCQSYMNELFRHIGPETDVPAGDIGVGPREIGYLFGQYKRLSRTFNGTLTGKGLSWGGSVLRPEATGYGVSYIAAATLRANNESLAGQTVAVSGFGNVAWGVVKKVTELGGKVVTLSGPDGFIFDKAGISGEKIDYMCKMRFGGRDEVRQYAERFDVDFHEAGKPWVVPCDIAMPCAIQNELLQDDAVTLAKNGCRYVIEGANMPTAREAIQVLKDSNIVFVPGKAANAGGVAVSGLEMAQNGARQHWSQEKVDTLLLQTMEMIHDMCLEVADECGRPGDYITGANVAGFKKVADAMIDQGVV